MSEIFGDVQPPAWLQRITTPSEPGLLGKVFGQLVGGLGDSAKIAFQRAKDKQAEGIDTNWLKELPGSIQPGLYEARMNIEDPKWRQELQAAQLNLAAQKMNLDTTQFKLNEAKRDSAQWDEDAPKLSKWLSLPWQEQLATPIDVRSTKGIDLVEKSRAAAVRLSLDASVQKVKTTFAQALLGIDDPATIQKVRSIPPLPDGSPSQEQQAIVNDWLQKHNQPAMGQKREPLPPAAVRNADAIQAAGDEMRAALQANDTEAYQRAKERQDLIIEQSRKMGMTVTTDKDGNVKVEFGPAGGTPSTPTVATRTKMQETLVKYQNNDQAIDALANQLSPSMVGFQGVIGEFVVDRFLAQLDPSLVQGERVEGRTALRLLKEEMLRQVQEDPSRFGGIDRQEIEDIFPSTGTFESVQRSLHAMATIKEKFAMRAINAAHELQMPGPDWALKGLRRSAVLGLLKKGTINREEANAALLGRELDRFGNPSEWFEFPNNAHPLSFPK